MDECDRRISAGGLVIGREWLAAAFLALGSILSRSSL
jgi:hypothetical protein